jgi:carbonic anhydrase
LLALLNVKEQVYDLSKLSIVQGAWRNGQDLTVHGWVYGLNQVMLQTLQVNMSSNADDLDEVYRQLKNSKIA